MTHTARTTRCTAAFIRRVSLLAAAIVGTAIVASGCSPAAGRHALTVSAAASLRPAFADLERDFEATHPGVDVRFNFEASSTLAHQIEQGAPADVFVSADRATMDRIAERGLVAGSAVTVASNHLTIVTKPGNPTGIRSVQDLTGAGVIALCDEDAPCGRYASEILYRAGVSLPGDRVTRTATPTAALAAVAEGDAAAAIVYRTDAQAASERVSVVELSPELDVPVTYLAAVLSRSQVPDEARAFIDHLRSPAAVAVLERHGFGPP